MLIEIFFWRQICIELSSKIGNQLFSLCGRFNPTIHTNTNTISTYLIMIKEDVTDNELFVIYDANKVEDNAKDRDFFINPQKKINS